MKTEERKYTKKNVKQNSKANQLPHPTNTGANTKNSREKNKTTAIVSFIFGLTFWIPLLNLFFGIVAIFVGIKALKEIKSDPRMYNGKWFAICGMILGAIPIFVFLVGFIMCLLGNNAICQTMGLDFLARQ